MRASRGAETVVPTVRSHLRVQVFDGDQGGITGERWGASAPVGWWSDAELECVNEIDRKWAWGRERERARGDMLRAGWGWIGGGGAREG
jgi:hypothetical protein